MQSYTEIKPTDYVKDSREDINNNFITLMSDFSGTVFPTNDLVAGMKCNRTDRKKVYILQQDLATWTELFDYNNNKVTVPNATAARSAANDATGQEIAGTYIKGVVQKNGAEATLEITKGDGTKVDLALSLNKGSVGLNKVDNTPDAEKNVSHAVTADSTTKDSEGNVIASTYLHIASAGMWQPNETIKVGEVRFLQGGEYAGYYLKCVTAGTTGTTQPAPIIGATNNVVDSTAKWKIERIASESNINLIKDYPQLYFERGNGADGVFNPQTNTEISGIKQYTSVNIPAGVTVTVKGWARIKCQGTVTVAGTLKATFLAGGIGGSQPGSSGSAGTAGGDGEYCGTGGAGGTAYGGAGGAGGAALGSEGIYAVVTNDDAVLMRVASYKFGYGASGGGGGRDRGYAVKGGNGGDGGGSLVIVAKAINVTGHINADGANGGAGEGWPSSGGGGGGGGEVICIAESITGSNITAKGGSAGENNEAGSGAVTAVAGTDGIVVLKQLGAIE